MRIVVSGSLGHIGRPLTRALVKNGHHVTVISSRSERLDEIIGLGAIPAFGTLEDADFLVETFEGADAVFCMEPPVDFFDKNLDIIRYYKEIGENFVQAIGLNNIEKVVHLSSIGAHMPNGNGVIQFHYHVEQILRSLPEQIHIKFVRPVGFYYNLLAFAQSVKAVGKMASVYGEDDIVPWVSPLDIAAVIAREFELPFDQPSKVRYVASDELSCKEVAQIFGKAIGRPELQWIRITEQQQLDILLNAGMSEAAARGLVEMNKATHDGTLYEDYYKNRPELGSHKLADFAPIFAETYQNL
ncbi:NmrA family NAD(P)-binding protein [Flagellimonas olearia]|uniref:NAD-dependent dehydratase n=1 Tax=Flagellimonas olearia TaxID=552546 RepID=A0A444VJU2_9FLAO|nr:NmrA family NAD(P)-binding protein [Allomuricauda olearia]RYC51038.1 NAD-dependent dehydratase [Allomuricauda olearia]